VVPEVVRALPRDMLADALGRSLVAGLKAVPAGLAQSQIRHPVRRQLPTTLQNFSDGHQESAIAQ
jgi:hypothetical protein